MDSHRIVVGVEGSGYARAALIWAIQEAEVRNSLVEVVTVYGPTFVPASPDLGYVPLDSFDLLNEVENTQSEVIESALTATNNPDIEIRRTVVKGR
ncbi:MAG TPA: universal stress protein, partial [Acidimicrobiales bacterium]|nr:universal stress protein [Acidimicrobiales bacterium]